MAICFLFTEQLNDEGCLSLCLDQQSQVSAPLQQRSFAEIRELQVNNQTYVIVPTNHFSLHQVELPLLPEKKARAAIPFALEDNLAQNFSQLHFAFERRYYKNGHYLVVVVDKTFLTDLINKLDTEHLNFDRITLSWFALEINEAALLENYLLVNNGNFQGSVDEDLAKLYLMKNGLDGVLYTFKGSKTSLPSIPNTPMIVTEEPASLWLAKRLQKIKPMNLCQGGFEHSSSQAKAKRWYQAAIILSLAWLISLVAGNALKLHYLNQTSSVVDGEIAAIYHKFFPQSQQVISPKFRINQLLQSNKNNADSNFWQLLAKLAKTLGKSSFTIEQFRFQNQTLIVTLATKDFAHLEEVQTTLQQDQVKVKQTQALMRNNQVVGTLELSL